MCFSAYFEFLKTYAIYSSFFLKWEPNMTIVNHGERPKVDATFNTNIATETHISEFSNRICVLFILYQIVLPVIVTIPDMHLRSTHTRSTFFEQQCRQLPVQRRCRAASSWYGSWLTLYRIGFCTALRVIQTGDPIDTSRAISGTVLAWILPAMVGSSTHKFICQHKKISD